MRNQKTWHPTKSQPDPCIALQYKSTKYKNKHKSQIHYHNNNKKKQKYRQKSNTIKQLGFQKLTNFYRLSPLFAREERSERVVEERALEDRL